MAKSASLKKTANCKLAWRIRPSIRQLQLLSSYLLNLKKGATAVRDLIVGDIRRFRDLGAQQQVSDLLIVLECFLSEFPDAAFSRGI
jgi:hypothetical protein